ncbi:cohesin domain-containing protein [Haloferacaceae archaeon DSL9]
MSRQIPALLALCCVCLLLVGVVTPLASAGDNMSTIQFDPRDTDVEPGETVEIDVWLQSHGAYGDTGVASVELIVEYDAEHLTVTGMEPGPWFVEGSDHDAEVSSSTDLDEPGVAVLTQELRPPANGATGYERIATLTVEVDEDAPTTTAKLSAGETAIVLTDRWPQPVSSQIASLHVDGGNAASDGAGTGGDETREGADSSENSSAEPDENDSATDAPATDGAGADEADDGGTDGGESGGDADGGESDSSLPAPVLGGLFGAAVLGLLILRRRA